MSQEPGKVFSISSSQPCAIPAEHFRLSEFISGDDQPDSTSTPSVNYHPYTDRPLLEGGDRDNTMAQKGCCLYFNLAWSLIGLLGGLSIFFTFFIQYKNFHAASWGFAGGVLAGATFHLHILRVRDRLEDWHNRATLTNIMVFGFITFILSMCGFVTYLVLAIIGKQTYQLDNSSFYPAATFSFYSLKWALTLMWVARNYRKILSLANPVLLPGMTSYSGTVIS